MLSAFVKSEYIFVLSIYIIDAFFWNAKVGPFGQVRGLSIFKFHSSFVQFDFMNLEKMFFQSTFRVVEASCLLS
jgi:hypothetical protein